MNKNSVCNDTAFIFNFVATVSVKVRYSEFFVVDVIPVVELYLPLLYQNSISKTR